MIGGVFNIHKMENWRLSKHRCTTIDFLLDKHNIKEIHFFSLDVEGYEREVLEGIDFNKTFIHCMVIESHKINDVWTNFDYLENFGFKKELQINNHIFFFNLKSTFKFNTYEQKECFNNWR
jgi:hypothetical protein